MDKSLKTWIFMVKRRGNLDLFIPIHIYLDIHK